MRSFFILTILALMCSCSMKKEQEIEEAIDVMQTLLTSGKCQEAIEIAEGLGRQYDHPVYVQVHASAYMCRAGFTEINFIDKDIDKIDSSSTGFMASLTTFSTSNETSAESNNYKDLRTALDILLRPASGPPSQLQRNSKFGASKAGDIGVQALILSLVQMGKFLKYYGNTDATGAKGTGSNVNDCFVSYTNNQAQLFLDGTSNGGACDNISTDLGHPDLPFSPAAALTTTKRRMCEGLMLVTNILDIVNNIDLPDHESMEGLRNVVDVINDYRDFVTSTNPSLDTLLNNTLQSTCETQVKSNTGFDDLQFVYALLFERGLP